MLISIVRQDHCFLNKLYHNCFRSLCVLCELRFIISNHFTSLQRTSYIIETLHTPNLFLLRSRGKTMNYDTIYSGTPITQHLIGYFRVLHAIPDAPNVDVYANDKLIVENLPYGQYTSYMPMCEGTYKISLYVAGSKTTPVLSNMLRIDTNSILTVAAIGTLSTRGLLAITDANTAKDPTTAMVRFGHLSPNAPAVDITLTDGTIMFSNVSFTQVTSYLAVPPSNYTLQVRLAGTPTVVLTVQNIDLEADKFYSIYAIGLVNAQPPLEALLTLDSNNYINSKIKS